MWHDPWSSSQVSSGDCLLLRCDGNTRIPYPMKQENGPSSRDEKGKTELFFSSAGHSMFYLSGDGYVGELLELHQGCHGSIPGSGRKVGFLSRRCSRKGPHLALRGECPGFSPIAAETLVSSRVMTGTSRTRLCCLRKVKSPCELRGASRDSSLIGSGA